MTHLLADENARNGHVAQPLQPLRSYQKIATTLRLPEERRSHRPAATRAKRPPQAVPAASWRPPRTWRELAFDLIFILVLPASVLLFVAFCVVAFVWLGWAIDRAIKSLNGGL